MSEAALNADPAGVALGGIRPLRHDDREPLRRLLVGTEMFTPAEIDIALELIDVVLQNAHQKDYIIRVMEDAGRIVGYYCVGPTPATEGTFDLYWIAVDAAGHGKGYGGALDAHAADLIRSMGGRLIIAETSSQPRYEKTRRFYLHHGYLEVARIPGYYRPDDDLVVYGKNLHS